MKAQLTIDLTPEQHNEIMQFVMDHKQPGEKFTLIGYPWLSDGVFKISLWHGHEAAALGNSRQDAT